MLVKSFTTYIAQLVSLKEYYRLIKY